MLGKPGGVFFLTADNMSADDAVLLAAAARAVLGGGRGSLTDQIGTRDGPPPDSTSATHSARLGQSCRASAANRLMG